MHSPGCHNTPHPAGHPVWSIYCQVASLERVLWGRFRECLEECSDTKSNSNDPRPVTLDHVDGHDASLRCIISIVFWQVFKLRLLILCLGA